MKNQKNLRASLWILALIAPIGFSACGDDSETDTSSFSDASGSDAGLVDTVDSGLVDTSKTPEVIEASEEDSPIDIFVPEGGDAEIGDASKDTAIEDVAEKDVQQPEKDASTKPTVPWYDGNFRYLPSKEGNLVTFVGGLAHPNQGGYGKVSTARTGHFNAMLAALFKAIDLALVDGSSPNWCNVLSLAQDAGYDLHRYRDSSTGRWMIYGADRTAYGQAYFFINPEGRRNIVVEAPHDPYDWATGKQAARVFLGLAARAVIINKEHRCSDPDATPCSGTTSVCDGYYRESDVAHHTANTFHLLHRYISDNDPSSNFVQLHGMTGSSSHMVCTGDGSTSSNRASSVSVTFTNALKNYVPNKKVVFSCQDKDNPPPTRLCGSTNVQGRATNASSIQECTTGTSKSAGRFLHIEQAKSLREDKETNGWFWTQVRDALKDTWPTCKNNKCGIGSSQPKLADCTCGKSCTPQAQ